MSDKAFKDHRLDQRPSQCWAILQALLRHNRAYVVYKHIPFDVEE